MGFAALGKSSHRHIGDFAVYEGELNQQQIKVRIGAVWYNFQISSCFFFCAYTGLITASIWL